MSRGLSFDRSTYTAAADASYVSKPHTEFRIPETGQKTAAQKASQLFNNTLSDLKEKAHKKQMETVTKIITEHPRKQKNVDAESMAEMIIHAGRETGIDPVIIAYIAGEETGYKQNVPTDNGSGIMQLTTITIKDMFLRPNYYGGNIKSILNKYKTPEKLMEAARTDPQLNLILGAYCFKAKNKLANGNLKKALEFYNTTDLKFTYSNNIYSGIQKTRESQSRYFENMA